MKLKILAGCLFLGLGFGSPLFAETADDYYKEAAQFYAQKDWDHAYDAYQGASGLDPNPYRAFAGMGNCEYARGHKSKAMENYRLSLKLYPNNPGLVAFVQKLKEELNSKGGPFDRGRQAFNDKRYKDANQDFQEAVQDDPENLPAFYYQAYCNYLTGDRAYAALNFAYYGMKKKDAKVQALANQIKSRLLPEDQDWVETQLKTEPPFPPPFRYSGVGVRLGAEVEFAALKDFNDYAKSLKAQFPQVSANGPLLALAADVNPFLEVTDGLEVGLKGGGVFLGGFSASTTSASPQQNGEISYDLWDFGADLKATFLRLDKGKIRFFLEAQPQAYLAGLSVVNSDTTSGWGFIPANGNFSTTGFGGLLKVGMEWKPLPNSLIGFFVGYQMANLTGFKGSAAANGSTTPVPGQLMTVRSGSTTNIDFVQDGTTPPAGAEPLSLDLGGVLAGARLTALF